MGVKKLSVQTIVVNLFDVSLMLYLAAWVVFSQQAGILATSIVHLSTGFIILTSVLILIVTRFRLDLPVHMLWYIGFVFLSVFSSVVINNTNAIYNLFSIMLRVIWVAFFVMVRLYNCTSVGEYIVKLSWIGIIEICLLFMCIPPHEWINALIHGNRLGVGNIEVNMCALTLAYSVVFCFFGIWKGYKRYMAIGLVDLVVIMLFQSRTTYLVMIAGIVIFLVSYYGISQKTVKRCLQYGITGVCLGMYILIFTDLGNKFLGRIFMYDDSIMYRILIIRTAIQIWWEKPFIGHGLGTIQVLMYEKLGRGWAAHNNMIGLLMCVGVIGFLYYYTYIFYWGAKFVIGKRRNKDLSIAFTVLVLTVLADIAGENYCAVLVQTLLAVAVGSVKMIGKRTDTLYNQKEEKQ